ncbi:PTS glucose transporter subunit IIA [Lactobacillus sp. ESL0680]|uniref:PTS sugar transporter subunit IIA n=1 Tax=Lactobacillus sp. ESL0680 TaxID=2983210 RepID=UPI0023F6EEF0|nr:PTS glucose transporter subunit IIA [Lactobacillus sp. ESL0680]WEV38849.1 PTS glucose transporter subunit IIA [Lactobacillus sp. ESL0680]
MFGFLKKKKPEFEVTAPIAGVVTDLSTVDDPVFSQKLMGDGFAIKLAADVDTVSAPVAGEIMSLPESKHAVGLVTPAGDEILIHIGIDTVNLNGAGFTALVKQGDSVKQGQELIKLDRQSLAANNVDLTTMVIFTKLAPANQDWTMTKDFGMQTASQDILVKQNQ